MTMDDGNGAPTKKLRCCDVRCGTVPRRGGIRDLWLCAWVASVVKRCMRKVG
jgi:hypothetical protein